MSLDFNPQSYAPDGTAIFGNDQQLLIRFFKEPHLLTHQSKESGASVYEDQIMIEVFQPGEKESVKVLADEFHKRRFPKQWEAFEKGLEQTAVGTPLDFLFPAEPSTVLTLKSFNVFNIQQLASLSDTGIHAIPMGRDLVNRAKKYLQTAETGADINRMEQMQKQIAELQAALAQKNEEQPETPQRRGPGRPPRPQGEIA